MVRNQTGQQDDVVEQTTFGSFGDKVVDTRLRGQVKLLRSAKGAGTGVVDLRHQDYVTKSMKDKDSKLPLL